MGYNYVKKGQKERDEKIDQNNKFVLPFQGFVPSQIVNTFY